MRLRPAHRRIIGIGVALALTLSAVAASAQPADVPIPRHKPSITCVAGR